jgi:hypothetical protein
MELNLRLRPFQGYAHNHCWLLWRRQIALNVGGGTYRGTRWDKAHSTPTRRTWWRRSMSRECRSLCRTSSLRSNRRT